MKGLSVHIFRCGYCMSIGRLVTPTGKLRPVRFPATAALIRHPTRGSILFDTGYSSHFFNRTRRFPERFYRWVTPVRLSDQDSLRHQLQKMNIDPDMISQIILSHFHADHIGGVLDFPQATLRYHADAFKTYAALSRCQQVRNGFIAKLLPENFTSRSHPLSPQEFTPWTHHMDSVDLFADGSLHLVHLPGHAPGHCGLWVDAEAAPVFLVADAAWFQTEISASTRLTPAAKNILYDADAYAQTQQKLQAYRSDSPKPQVVVCHDPEELPS